MFFCITWFNVYNSFFSLVIRCINTCIDYNKIGYNLSCQVNMSVVPRYNSLLHMEAFHDHMSSYLCWSLPDPEAQINAHDASVLLKGLPPCATEE